MHHQRPARKFDYAPTKWREHGGHKAPDTVPIAGIRTGFETSVRSEKVPACAKGVAPIEVWCQPQEALEGQSGQQENHCLLCWWQGVCPRHGGTGGCQT